MLSASSDVGDVLSALQAQQGKGGGGELIDGGVNNGRCTGFVKYVAGGSGELLFGHTTWTLFNQALRVLKTYNVALGSGGDYVSVQFSSYPGSVFSGDDFYQTYHYRSGAFHSKLAIFETTAGVFNTSIFKHVLPEQLPTFVRAMLASRLATSARQWVAEFAKHNSGTYNNQWVAADYALFERSKRTLSAPHTVVLLEQLPGKTATLDLTPLLRAATYFGSYNLWMLPAMVAYSGQYLQAQNTQKYGKWASFFSYHKAPRALILARNQSAVHDAATFEALMQYDRFETDPLSGGFGENAIMSRSDLQPVLPHYPVPAFRPRCHGGIDWKATSAALVRRNAFRAQGAQTHIDQPVFQWSTASAACKPYKHIGLPDTYNFDGQIFIANTKSAWE